MGGEEGGGVCVTSYFLFMLEYRERKREKLKLPKENA